MVNDRHLHRSWYFIAALIENKNEVDLEALKAMFVHFDLSQVEFRGDPLYVDCSLLITPSKQSVCYIEEALRGEYDTFNALFVINNSKLSLSDSGKKHFKDTDFDTNPFAILGESSEYLKDAIEEAINSYSEIPIQELRELSCEYYYTVSNTYIHYGDLVRVGCFSDGVKEAYDESLSLERFKKKHFR
ncbi:hypothetical protein [Vibrio crassostreae]|uniref:hypothetical protein n=1 Tax=Vibrio crassostreae TaxID=246167 RepID=UPI001B3041FD|nr:hypothetical protein [Vibrio crassostreae]